MKRILVALALMSACTKPTEPADPAAPHAPPLMAGTPRPAGTEGLIQGGGAYATQMLTVRKEPSEAKEVEEPGKKKKTVNWLATVYRGEQVVALDTKGDWSHVRLSDSKEGWVKTDTVLTGSIELATVFDKTKVFTRPDLLALNAGRQIEPGSLLFVLRAKDQFSEVNAGGVNTLWVLTDVLTQDVREVEAAKLIGRAKALTERRDNAADVALDLAKSQYASTKLVQTLLLAPDPNTQVDPNIQVAPNRPAAVPQPEGH